MWNSDYLIKIELGEGIIKAANCSKQQGNLKLIMDGIKEIRKELDGNDIILPPVHLSDNTNIKPNEFICYWGLEKGHFSITYLKDLFEFIYNKATEYAENNNATFMQALETMEQDHYQNAYDTYKKLYYYARQKNDFHSSARALTEVSGIVALSGQMKYAIKLAAEAVKYAESYNIVDQTLKCQAYLNLGSIMKCSDAVNALGYFHHCSKIAYKSNNSQFLFFSFLGMAESYYIIGDIEKSIDYYESSLDLVNDTETALFIQKRMIRLYRILVEQLRSDNPERHMNSRFKDLMFDILKQIGKELCKTALFKILNLKGYGALLSIGTKYIIDNNVFNSPVVIGDNNSINK